MAKQSATRAAAPLVPSPRGGRRGRPPRAGKKLALEALEPRLALNGAGLPYLGWNYVSFNSGELPVATSWVEQDWPGSDGVSDLQIVSVAGPSGQEGALRARADLFRACQRHYADGEVYVDLRYRFAHPPEDAARPIPCGALTRDLTDSVITVEIRLDDSLLGAVSAPNGTQIFLKSVDVDAQGTETWGSYYGTWHNALSGWQTLVLNPSTDVPAYVDPSFDLSKVALLGIKLGTNEAAIGCWEGWMDVASVSIQFQDHTVSQYPFENTEDAITRLVQTGANTVALVDHWFVDSLTGWEIDPDENITQQYPGSPTALIEETINRLHAEGMVVHVKPHLDVAGFDYDEEAGEWRGEIRPADEFLPAFFASYKSFIGSYAEIAQRTGAQGLVIETELAQLDTDPNLRPYWEDIVTSLRQTYSGDLIVAANWDSYQDHTFLDLVDLVGIDAYFPLTDALDPSVEDLKAAWRNCQVAGYEGEDWAAEIANWSVTLGKPFYFTEIGITSRDGAAEEPASVCKEGDVAQFNEALQVAYYEAALEVFSQNEHFAGLLGWAWVPWSDAGGVGDVDFTPQNKAMETEAPRLFLPVSLHEGTLRARGTFDDDLFQLSGNDNSIELVLNGQPHQFPRAEVASLRLLGLAGNDTYQSALPAVPTTIEDTAGSDTLDFSAAGQGVTIELTSALPQTIAPGNTLTLASTIENVIGTGFDDQFEFDAAALGQLAATSAYKSNSEEPTSFTFDGGQGNDHAITRGADTDDWVKLWPDHGHVAGVGYTVSTTNVESATAVAGGGQDVAQLFDSDQTDTFKAWPDSARMSGPGFSLDVEAFDYVHAYSSADNNDVALLYGDPDQDDIFEAWPQMARLHGKDYYNRVKSFRWVHAYGNVGNDDLALLYGDPDKSDTFQAWSQMARYYGAHFYNRVKSFRWVHAYSKTGGADQAYLYDSPDHDRFKAWGHMAKLYSTDFYNRALYFDQGQAIAEERDDSDTADAFEATAWQAVGDWEKGNMTPIPPPPGSGQLSRLAKLSAALAATDRADGDDSHDPQRKGRHVDPAAIDCLMAKD